MNPEKSTPVSPLQTPEASIASLIRPSKEQGMWKFVFGKIDSENRAIQMIYSSSIIFFLMAALLIIWGAVDSLTTLVYGSIFAILSFLLRRFKYRIISISILLFTIYLLVSYLLALDNDLRIVAASLIYRVFVFLIAIKATQATITYHSLKMKTLKVKKS